jgi:transposase
MARHKAYDYGQTTMIAVDLEKQLISGSIEYVIHKLVEERIDMRLFERKIKNDKTGRPAYDPKILLKIVLLAYTRGIISSRKIEEACRENVMFMALSCMQYPDHSTIAHFVSGMEKEIMPLFRDILLVCDELELLGETSFALDGLKLPSNASKHLSGTHAELKRKKEKLEKRITKYLRKKQLTDKRTKEKESKADDQRAHQKINKLRKTVEKIDRFLVENEPKIGKQGKEVKSNITDKDSCKMSTSDGVLQGYNGQALVDEKHQIIIHPEAFGSGQDYSHVSPMIDGAKNNIKAIGKKESYFEEKTFTADANYHSSENLEKCEKEKLDAYIPDVDFRKRDKRFVTQKKYKDELIERYELEDYTYDSQKDLYICPERKELRRQSSKSIKNGYNQYAAKESDCMGCNQKCTCIRMPHGKRKHLTIPVKLQEESISKRMRDKIDTEEGRAKYEKRMGIVEPVFGNIKARKKLNYFTLRTKIKVNIQWTLYSMVHNVEKIANYGTI